MPRGRSGFPKKSFDGGKFEENRGRIKESREQAQCNLRIPYLGKPSVWFKKEIVKEIEKYFGLPLDTSFFSCKIGDFFSLKCKTPEFLLANVVYKFECFLDENTAYIGKTDRHLQTFGHQNFGTS